MIINTSQERSFITNYTQIPANYYSFNSKIIFYTCNHELCNHSILRRTICEVISSSLKLHALKIPLEWIFLHKEAIKRNEHNDPLSAIGKRPFSVHIWGFHSST